MSEAVDHWVATFEANERAGARSAAALPRSEPPWLSARRAAALGRLQKRGFPTRREEAWKYTNPRRVADVSYGPAPALDLDAASLDALSLVPADGPRAVFANGRFQAALSTLSSLPTGLFCLPVGAVGAEATAGDDAMRAALDAAPVLEDRSFAALADAFFEDGLLLRSEPGAQIEAPFTVVHVCGEHAADDASPFANHPRLWVHAGAQSRLTVHEIFVSLDASEHLTNVFSQYLADEGASLTRTSIQAESMSATFLSAVAIRAGRDARVRNTAFSIGARLAREDLVCELSGTGAECDLRGLYLSGEGQHSDHHTVVDHSVPHCSSRQLYRGVLAGHSRAAFTGTVVVRPNAQKSDAQQKNESLLLSEHAEADSKPQLEIYADDVKCSHGSTIGQLDPGQIFYLRSRGIGAQEARDLLIRGFAAAISNEVDDPSLREAIERRMDACLDQGSPR